MSITLIVYRFSRGAKKDLVALNNTYTFSGIVGTVKKARKNGVKSVKIVTNSLVIFEKDRVILGVSLKHLTEYPRTLLFKCDVCFDSHTIQVGDVCDYCSGNGCKECNGGLQYNTIACPNCTAKNTLRRDNDEWSDSLKHKRQQRHGNRG